ncbi:MAG: rhodanese-like domain-containing protein [Nocardioides sp.]
MRDVDLSTFVQAHAEGAVVVDVRESMEYHRAHVPGALLMPMSQIGARYTELDRSQRLYIICATGNRSAAITDALRHAGYDAVNVLGGTMAWMRAGYALDSGLPAAS